MPTIGAFPKALEWQQWWRYWSEKIGESQPWVRFLVDATTTLQQMFVRISRLLRQKPNWDTQGWTPEEWMSVIDTVDEKFAWFQKNKPRREEVPLWALILLDAIEGAYLMMSRLAREVDQIQRKGHLLINVNPETEGTLAELGSEESR